MKDMPLQRQAVPAYFHPDDGAEDWAQLASCGVALVVANVADGPGMVREAPWARALSAVRASGSHVVGYVDTGYLGLTGLSTRRGSTLINDWLEQILHDIDDWYTLYGDVVTGIFFDQVTESEDGASVAPVLRRLREHVLQQDAVAVTVLNPGVAAPVAFADLADILVTFEGPCQAYLAQEGEHVFEPLTWQPGPDQLIWHIVHSTPPARVAEVITLSHERGARLLYVTDGRGSNPYSSLPSAAVQEALAADSHESTPSLCPPAHEVVVSHHVEDLADMPSTIDPDAVLISNPTLVRVENTIEASADFVVPSSSRRVFLASRRRNVPRWWTGSSPQIAADWLIENNRLYAYAGSGTDWTWRPTGQVTFEALGNRACWYLEADLLGLDTDNDADAAFHVSAPGHREYSDVAIGRRAVSEPQAEMGTA